MTNSNGHSRRNLSDRLNNVDKETSCFPFKAQKVPYSGIEDQSETNPTKSWVWLAERYGVSPDRVTPEERHLLVCAARDIRLLHTDLRTLAERTEGQWPRYTRCDDAMNTVRKFDLMPKDE